MTVAELRKALEGLPDDMKVHLCASSSSGQLKKIWISRNWDDKKKKLRDHLVLDDDPAPSTPYQLPLP